MKRATSPALFALFLIGLLLANVSCGEVPRASWERLKQIRHHLLESEADRWVPEDSEAFEARYLLVREKLIAFEAQWAWLRSGEGLRQLTDEITQLQQEGEGQVRRAQELREEKMENLRMEMAALEDLLDPNRRKTLIPELRLQMTTASLQLARLQLHLAEGDPWSAEEALQELRQSSQEFSNYFDRLEQRFSDPSQTEKWNRLSEKALALSGTERRGVLIVDKYHRKVLLLKNRRLSRSFDADLGWNGLDDKLRQGDGATPEGEYLVRKLKGARETKYHRALLLNYPNPSDRRDFEDLVRSGQLPKSARIGSLIEIHGEGGRGEDWTDGCVALDNTEMEILFGQAYVGMPVFVVGKCRIIQ